MTCITRISKRILQETEHIKPHPEPPWRLMEINIPDNVQIFLPTNTPSQSSKEEWTDNHIKFTTEIEDNDHCLIIYSDGSLMGKNGRRRSGYGVVGYIQGHEVFRQGEALGEHTKAYDTKMAGLQAAAEETKRFILDTWTEPKPKKIIFYADDSAAITKIFEGAHGKAQQHSKGFRRAIGSILSNNTEMKIAISWCPGHSGIIGNEEADKLAKSALLPTPLNPNYKTQAYVGALHKRELLEEWRFRWMNTLNPPQSGFHLANRLPLTLKPTERFTQTDCQTFSRLVQCQTGHAHISKYYKSILTKSMGCPCRTTIQTCEHLLKQCKNHI